MKNLLIVFLFLSSVKMLALDVSVTCLSYCQDQPYIELYSRFLGGTIQFVANGGDSLLQSTVEMLVLISDEQGNVRIAEKYNVQSEGLEVKDFYTMKRYGLSDGEYDLSIQFVDMNNVSDTLLHKEKIEIGYPESSLSISDPLLITEYSDDKNQFAFYKNGIAFEPPIYKVFGPKHNALSFYVEIYNADALDEQLFARYSVRQRDTKEEVYKPAYKKLSSEETGMILESFDISSLVSGDYEFVMEVVNKDMEVLAERLSDMAVYHPDRDFEVQYQGDLSFETSFVQAMDEGELNYSLKAIFPRVSNSLTPIINDIIWGDNLKTKRYFLYNFWSKYSDVDPKSIYDQYMEVARAVDRRFAANLGHGFETDRGYIFLKYGKPDDLVEVPDEPSAPPYEIWIYNFLVETNQTGVKFLFYNEELAPNEFRLLHSTCRGELQNPRWEVELYKSDRLAPIGNVVDANTVQDGFNRNARRYFSDN